MERPACLFSVGTRRVALRTDWREKIFGFCGTHCCLLECAVETVAGWDEAGGGFVGRKKSGPDVCPESLRNDVVLRRLVRTLPRHRPARVSRSVRETRRRHLP